ncbi:hypothetical protein CyaNS01_02425 [Cyanobium sp. NS01]|nr:hypothetical protein [Cyanobium sp. NS01]QNI71542.1 hypothetical protein CyaNS01_02425 [Cyanobium sp. NS01]
MTASHINTSFAPRSGEHPATAAFPAADHDPVEAYFECITSCSVDDGECVTTCTEILREHN